MKKKQYEDDKDKFVKEDRSNGRNYKSNNRSNNRGKSRKGRPSERSTKTDVTTGEPFREYKTTQKGTNDASWYAKNPQLLADSASFSFNAALGSRVGWDFDVHEAVSTGYDLNPNFDSICPTLPGILALHYANYPGISKGRSSAINIASENIYSFIRHANSGHANYEPSDLMMYFNAMDGLYSFIAYCRRIYGTARLFNQKNYYYQRALIAVQGINYDNLIANLADFRAYINTLSAKASAFAVPSSMPIMQRHFFMASNIYKDRDTEKSQLYLFVPEGFHYYNETPSVVAPYKDAGGCVFRPLPGWNESTQTTMTVQDLYTYGDFLIAQLLKSEDIGIMSGDVLKAFQGNIFSIPATPEEYTVMPIYDPEVLSQIQNANASPIAVRRYIRNGYAVDWDALDILQDPNNSLIVADFNAASNLPIDGIKWQNYSSMLSTGNRILTFNFDHPTPADVMVGTRLMQYWSVELNGFTPSGDDKSYWSCEGVGTEIVLYFQFCELMANGNVGVREVDANVVNISFDGSAVYTGWDKLRDLVSVSNFDCHPIIMTGDVEWTSSTQLLTISPYGIFGDVDTYRVLTAEDLRKLNQTALLSLYGVPALGTY